MAINIFQGGSKPKSGVNSAKASTRAANAQAALKTVGETSSSGATAVARKGTLSKVGNFVGKAAGIASKFLPGIGGTVAKGLANLFNDPEWWQSVPGDAITLNTPLRTVLLKQAPSVQPGQHSQHAARYTFGEFTSTEGSSMTAGDYVMQPTDAMVTQYLMSEIRKVVNAIPLQTADSYKKVLGANATAYALWRNLLKYDYLLKHGQTYLPSFNDSAFPILQVENAATLQSYINRLEEYLRASVRLPHTLCEYLAWRYGRIYKSNDSAKSGLILYDVIPITSSMDKYAAVIQALTTVNSTTTELQQANADLYNTYYDHDQAVVIRDDTQFVFDKKEFMLRTNLDLGSSGDETQNIINIDSSLDNPTSFMASTVSTRAGSDGALFPVVGGFAYIPADEFILDQAKFILGNQPLLTRKLGTAWVYTNLSSGNPTNTADYVAEALVATMACKSLDIYNKNIWLVVGSTTASDAFSYWYDLTAISIDAGQVTDLVLANEQVYAFANLVHMDRKRGDTYAQAEKQVARDTANLVETLDVATKA